MLTLGIETTCDEMAAAVVKDHVYIVSNVIASQSEFHKKFGGVHPEMAARQHMDLLIPTIDKALYQANITSKDIDLIAVAKGPGLIGPLFIGLNTAKTLSMAWNIPFLGISHVEAHLYAAMMSHKTFIFPAIGVVISGGHTFLVHIIDIGHYVLIGKTVDDAIGEAFDKVASLLGLTYPGGPKIEQLAKEGDPKRYPYKIGSVKDRPWDFSFSGLKTSVLYTVKGQNRKKQESMQITEKDMPDVAASFQRAAFSALMQKIFKAVETFESRAIYIGGGVSQNMYLRQVLKEKSHIPVYFPEKDLSLDNAAMIAGLGSYLFQGKGDPLDLEPKTRFENMLV